MNKLRNKIETMLDEPSWDATQRTEATAILDQLARLGILYHDDEQAGRDEDGKFIGGEE